MASADVYVFGATESSPATAADACPVPSVNVQCLHDARNCATDEPPATGPRSPEATQAQEDKGESPGRHSSGNGPAVPNSRTSGVAPAEAGQEGQGKLAEYFGVVFSQGSASPTRNPGGRVRRNVGHLSMLTPSPPGPLEASMRAGMAAISRMRLDEKTLDDSPAPPCASPTREELVTMQTRAMLELRGIEAKIGASLACSIGNMDSLTKRKAKILSRQCGSMLSPGGDASAGGAKSTGRPSGRPLLPVPFSRGTPRALSWSDAAARRDALNSAERGMRASWTERAAALSADREVPGAAASFVELEALRWENRRLSDAKVADQARRLAALEDALKEARLRPMARRRCLEGGENDPVSALERQLSSVTQELEVLLKQHEEQHARVEAAEAGRLEAARKAADAVGERDLARQMLKGVQAMLGHAEAARASAQKALLQAQAEKAASQAVVAKGEERRARHAAELEGIRLSRELAEAQLADAQAKLAQVQAALAQGDTRPALAVAQAPEAPPEALSPPPSASHATTARAAELEAEVHRLRQEAAEAAEAKSELRRELQVAICKWENAAAERAATEAALKSEAAAELAAVRKEAETAVQTKAEDMKRWAAAADEAAAQREARIGALEAERDTLKRAALAELTVCRDAGLQAVYELEAQVAELSAQKAEAEEESKRYQRQVAQQRQGLSKNRAQAEEEIAVAEDKAARLAAEKWNAAADAACHAERAARLDAELAELRAQLGRSAEEAKAAADARAAELAAARDAAEAEAERLRGSLAEAAKERDFALAAKHAAADAAAALEKKVSGRAEGKRQAVTTLQSAISQLQMERDAIRRAHESTQAALQQTHADAAQLKGAHASELAALQEAIAAADVRCAALEKNQQQQQRGEESAPGGAAEVQELQVALARSRDTVATLQEQLTCAEDLKLAAICEAHLLSGASEQAHKHKGRAEEFAAALREAEAEVAELRQRLAQQQEEGTRASTPSSRERPAQKLALSLAALPSSSVGAKAVAQLPARIRVLARVRPMSRSEAATCIQSPFYAIHSRWLSLNSSSPCVAPQTYQFDRVFSDSQGQDEVYAEVAGHVSRVLSGANACVLAYGDATSGKAFTLAGTPSEPGINFRAMQDLFRLAQEGSPERDARIGMSIVEIQGATLQDLLSANAHRRLEVKAVEDGVCVPGLTIKLVTCTADVAALMLVTCPDAQQQHAEASHLVLSVYVACKKRATGAATLGKLHMVNLAAPEAAKRMEDPSLDAVISCMQAAQAGMPQVPYADSCLTRYLADSMGSGHSRAILIATCSPMVQDIAKTRSTLELCASATAGAVEAACLRGSEISKGTCSIVAGRPQTVAALAQTFEGSLTPGGNPRTESPVGAPTKSGAAHGLDKSAVSPFAEASGNPHVQLRFRDRHAK